MQKNIYEKNKNKKSIKIRIYKRLYYATQIQCSIKKKEKKREEKKKKIKQIKKT